MWTGDWSSDVCSSDLEHPVLREECMPVSGPPVLLDDPAEIPVAGPAERLVGRTTMQRGQVMRECLPRSEERRVGKGSSARVRRERRKSRRELANYSIM